MELHELFNQLKEDAERRKKLDALQEESVRRLLLLFLEVAVENRLAHPVVVLSAASRLTAIGIWATGTRLDVRQLTAQELREVQNCYDGLLGDLYDVVATLPANSREHGHLGDVLDRWLAAAKEEAFQDDALEQAAGRPQ